MVLLSNYFSPYRNALCFPLSKVLPLEVRHAANSDAGRGRQISGQSEVSYQPNFCNLWSTNWSMSDYWLPKKKWVDLKDENGVVTGAQEMPGCWFVVAKAKRLGAKKLDSMYPHQKPNPSLVVPLPNSEQSTS